MKTEEFFKFFEELHETEKKIMIEKGHDYTRGDEDKLANFKRTAKECGITPLQVWFVFVHKHWDSICTYIQKGCVSSEPIEGRFNDIRNYMALGLAIIKEQLDKDQTTSYLLDRTTGEKRQLS